MKPSDKNRNVLTVVCAGKGCGQPATLYKDGRQLCPQCFIKPEYIETSVPARTTDFHPGDLMSKELEKLHKPREKK